MATKVFISYAHESDDHSNKVLDFANFLRSKGIDAEIDQYEEAPSEGWPRWMTRQIQSSSFVLVVCSKLFYERANDYSGQTEGLGVKWETTLVLQELYQLNTNNTKFIPVLFSKSCTHHIPLPLQPYTYYDVSDPTKKDMLVERLLDLAQVKRPPLGQPAQPTGLPPKQRKTMFVASIINLDHWNKATWCGVAFMSDPSLEALPVVVLMFRGTEFGNKIFQEWRSQFGKTDHNEEIRLSFIEGISEENVNWYKVHIGLSWKAMTRRMKTSGLKPEECYFLGVTRIHEMNPPPETKNLEIFKHAFGYFKRYLLTNGDVVNGQVVPRMENAIEKREVFFRKKSEIVSNPNDEDCTVFAPPSENGE